MSQWHNDHPELAGTEADPWMSHPSHAAAAREVTAMRCRRTMLEVEELKTAASAAHRPSHTEPYHERRWT